MNATYSIIMTLLIVLAFASGLFYRGRKMTVSEFIEGLNIMVKNGLHDNWFMGAEHDQIYFYIDNELLPENSREGKRLIELGFFVDSDVCSWSMFT